jgi:acetolactate synthase-1/2/3 large subunit
MAMNGAESLVKTMLGGGVDVCFANPGTSEMHFVAALDGHPDMRCILCLFEGGVSGAADGYYRMKGDVAATMLHLAPGFGNAYANLHNASKAHSGIVNVVGDHASYHLGFDSPLKGNVDGVTAAISDWVRRAADATTTAEDVAAAIRAAREGAGKIATLILPGDAAWDAALAPAVVSAPNPRRAPAPEAIAAAARILRRPGAALIVGGDALHGQALTLAAKVAAATGCAFFSDFLFARLRRGAGEPVVTRLSAADEANMALLRDVTDMVLVGARRPVSFFAYPGKAQTPERPGTAIHDLADHDADLLATLRGLVEELDAEATAPKCAPVADLPAPTGALDLENLGRAIAHLMPEDAILVDESVTSGRAMAPFIAAGRPHDLLTSAGASIGFGLPAAVGAAVARPDRKVVALTGDGSAMYTIQSLWTMAREELDVTVVVFANRGYQILRGELANVGVKDYGRNAVNMLEVTDPTLDFAAMAKGHGVPGERVDTLDAFLDAFARGLATPGPYLVEVTL